MKFRIIVGAGALLSSTFAQAAEWHVVTSDERGVTFSLDAEEKPTDATERTFWVKIDFRNRTLSETELEVRKREEELAKRGLLACKGVVSPLCRPGMYEPLERLERWTIDCANLTIRVVQTISYGAGGQVLETKTLAQSPFTVIPPDTIAEALANVVCQQGG